MMLVMISNTINVYANAIGMVGSFLSKGRSGPTIANPRAHQTPGHSASDLTSVMACRLPPRLRRRPSVLDSAWGFPRLRLRLSALDSAATSARGFPCLRLRPFALDSAATSARGFPCLRPRPRAYGFAAGFDLGPRLWLFGYVLAVADDRREFLGVQARAADQRAVHVRLSHDGGDVGRLHRAAVLDAD